jgi:hypothetical protein
MNKTWLDVIQEPNFNFFLGLQVRSFFCCDNLIGKQPFNYIFSIELKQYALGIQFGSVNVFTPRLFFFECVELYPFFPFGFRPRVSIGAGNKWDSITYSAFYSESCCIFEIFGIALVLSKRARQPQKPNPKIIIVV